MKKLNTVSQKTLGLLESVCLIILVKPKIRSTQKK